MKWLKHNSLSLVFFILFIISIIGQVVTGLKEHNLQMQDEGGQQLNMAQYMTSGHFLQSTFENWESEFLQMALFVLLTIFLRQKGSSESKKMDEEEEVDEEPSPEKQGAPWPVRQGGFILVVYKHSLSLLFFILFILSFALHFYGSLKDENEELMTKNLPAESAGEYIVDPRFWFESFQNWQSEFLSVFCIVVFSIFLREKGSPQSKPVDAPHDETGE
jgi:hypothetical protein